MRRVKSAFCWLLAMILLLQPAMSVQAENNTAQSEQNIVTGVRVNPLYQDVVSEEELEGQLEAETAKVSKGVGLITQKEDVIIDTIQEAMLARETTIDITYKTSDDYENGWIESVFGAVLEETDNPKGGDYLRWVYGGYSYSISIGSSSSGYVYQISLTIAYYTTAEQEAELDVEVAKVLKDLGVYDSGTSDYEKLRLIYDYICDNIVYDYENLNDSSYMLKYTAYAAMMNKTAVCQGYATLLYYMLEEVGIDTRIISGIGNGGAHGWNIAKLGTKYYLLDSTWDAILTNYQYFLKGTNNFPDHTAQSDFYNSYPISAADYVINENAMGCDHEWALDDEQTQKATCTEEGLAVYSCVNCGVERVETLKATGHAYGDPEVVDPTCTEDGMEISTCKNCGYQLVEKIPANGHECAESTTPATLTKDGTYIKVCCECGEQWSETIARPTSIKLSTTTYTYNGNVRKPTVKVTDKNGNVISSSNYTVTYATGRKNVGKYKVTIKFKGDYSGTVYRYFTINPKGTSITSLTKGTKRFTVKWSKRTTQVTGYQIRYSTSKTFASNNKMVTITSNKTTSKLVKSLKAKKKYYVQVRTYKTVNGTKYYSAWSAKKYVTTK